MDMNPINSSTDHEAALREIEGLWNAPEGTPEGARLDVLLDLVEAYEDVHFPMSPSGSAK